MLATNIFKVPKLVIYLYIYDHRGKNERNILS